MVSMEVVGPESVYVEGDTMRNKYWVGLLKCSKGQMIVDKFIDNRLVIN